MECLYTLFKYRFSEKVFAKKRQVFDNVQRAVDFNQRNKGVDRMPSIAKNRLSRKKYKNIDSAPLKSEKQRRLVDRSLQTELNELKRLTLSWN